MKKKKIIFALILLSIFSIPLLIPSHELALLEITGKTSQEEVEWKNPYSPLRKEKLNTYQVKIQLFKGKEIEEFFFGEIIGIRYKVLELYPFFRFLGYKDKVFLDTVYSDYLDIDKKKNLPVTILTLNREKSALWERLFFQGVSFLWFSKARLKTEYVPLIDARGVKPLKQSYLVSFKKGSLEIRQVSSQDLLLFQAGS